MIKNGVGRDLEWDDLGLFQQLRVGTEENRENRVTIMCEMTQDSNRCFRVQVKSFIATPTHTVDSFGYAAHPPHSVAGDRNLSLEHHVCSYVFSDV
jgi:hypothetical protein